MNKHRVALATVAAAALVGMGTIPATAATSSHHKPAPPKVTIRASASAAKVLTDTVVVFTFKVTSRPASSDISETDFFSARGGTLVFTSCTYGSGIDFTGYGDGRDCEDLPASSRQPITYLVGVQATGGVGTTVGATIRVDPDGLHDIYRSASATVYDVP